MSPLDIHLQRIAAGCGIVGVVGLIPGVPKGVKIVALGLLGVAIALMVIAGFVLSRAKVRKTPKHKMQQRGKELISNPRRSVVLFGGDMSWADEYKEAIRVARSKQKEVIVIHEPPESDAAKENVETLRKAGAEMHETSVEFGLRGILVDPGELGAMFWLADRRLKRGSRGSPSGEPGTEATHDYVTGEFTAKRDELFLHAVLTIYAVLKGS